MWPKYCGFSFATIPINSLSRPNSVNFESFVRCSCHEMLSIFLQHHILKASILFLSNFFKVHPSTPYWNTVQTIDFIDSSVLFVNMIFQKRMNQFCCKLVQVVSGARWWNGQLLGSGAQRSHYATRHHSRPLWLRFSSRYLATLCEMVVDVVMKLTE